jgi:hypothetical protein
VGVGGVRVELERLAKRRLGLIHRAGAELRLAQRGVRQGAGRRNLDRLLRGRQRVGRRRAHEAVREGNVRRRARRA